MSELGVPVEFRILGPLEAIGDDGSIIEIPSVLQRTLLLRLLIDAGHVVPVDHLIEDLWGEDLPKDPLNSLRYHVWKLRAILEPDRRKGISDGLIEARHPGYAIKAKASDVVGFERLVDEARRSREAHPVEARAKLAAALDLWRGRPYADLAYADFTQPEIRRLDELRLFALQERISLDLALGDTDLAIGELEALIAEHPLREDLWALLMKALEQAGRRADALRAYQRAKTVLGDELGVEPTTALKEVEEDVLFQRRLSLDAPPTGRHSLPSYESSFVGRESDVAELSQLLEQGRLVTIVGAPGIGKTRLAVEVASALQAERGLDVRFVDLAAVSNDRDVAGAVAETLGLESTGTAGANPAPAPGTVKAAVVEWFRQHEALVVFDNAEHVLDGVSGLVQTESSGNPRALILTTSRESLGASGERVVELQSLETPQSIHDGSGDVQNTAGVRLFLDRAADVGTVVGDDDVESVARIVRRLDGIPLAIELVAARSRGLAIADLDRFPEQVDRLGKRRSRDVRHRSVDEAIAWSEGLLDPHERTAVRALSVFLGGFDLDAAAAVLHGVDPALDAVGSVVSLRERSLLTAEQGRDRGRYRMLEPIRQHFASTEEAASTIRCAAKVHASYFADLAEDLWNARGDTREEQEVLAQVTADDPNIRCAVGHFIDERDHSRAVTMLGALTARVHSDFWSWIELLRLVDVPPAEIAPRDGARFLLLRANVEARTGQTSDAVDLAKEAEQLAEIAGDREMAAMARVVRVAAPWDFSFDVTTREILEIARTEIASPRLLNRLDWEEGLGWLWTGEYARAIDLFKELERRAIVIGDESAEIDALIGLGQAHRHEGRSAEAADCLRRAHTLAKSVGAHWDEAFALYMIGELLAADGDLDTAIETEEAALEMLLRRAPSDQWTNTVRTSLAKILRATGRLSDAAHRVKGGLDFCLRSDAEAIWSHGSWVLETAAGLLAEMGEITVAATVFAAAESNREQLDAPMPPWDVATYDRDVLIAGNALSAKEFQDVWSTGRRMSAPAAAVLASELLASHAGRA